MIYAPSDSMTMAGLLMVQYQRRNLQVLSRFKLVLDVHTTSQDAPQWTCGNGLMVIVLVAVMRKLALAIHAVARGEPFDIKRLFPGVKGVEETPHDLKEETVGDER